MLLTLCLCVEHIDTKSGGGLATCKCFGQTKPDQRHKGNRRPTAPNWRAQRIGSVRAWHPMSSGAPAEPDEPALGVNSTSDV